MMKKRLRTIFTVALAMTLCLSLFTAVNAKTAKADEETYTLAFETGKTSVDSMWAQGWWSGAGAAGYTGDGSMYTFDFEAANNAIYTHSASGAALTVGKSYCISFEYKADSDAYFHVAQNDPWVWVQTDIHATTEWQTFEKAFTAGCETLIFQGTPYKVYLKNLKFTEVETKTVAAGAAISALPEVPAKEGYTGYWTIDGEAITAETLYNYGADKIAKPAYKENTFKISFEDESDDVSKSLFGWWSESGANNGHTVDENGSEVDFNAAGKTVYNNFCQTVVGDAYRLSLSYKKVSGDGKFHVFHCGDSWVLVKDWLAASDDWQTLTATYTVSSANELIIFQEPAEANNSVILFKDITLTRIVSEKEGLKKGDAIGELPEIDAKQGYTGYWAIDGEKITAETVYNYEESKAAKLLYEANKYMLTLGETEIEVTYGKAIGELPAVPTKIGHTGYWTVNDVVITAETVYYETKNAVAAVKYEANKYKLTLGETEIEVTYGEEIGELPAIGAEARKGYEYAWFIDGVRLNEETVWEYAEDKTATATETLIQYKIEFKIGDTTVKTVYYTVEDEEVEEPAIIPREGYTAKWEDYTLDGGDKVVNAVYTEIKTPEESADDSSSADESDVDSSAGESSGETGGSSCSAGIGGVSLACGLLTIAAFALIIKKRKNA